MYESPFKASEEKPLATEARLYAAVLALKALSIDELIQKLDDKRVVENGFTVGDLSLALLAGFYYFDVERALQRSLEQKVLAYGKKGETLVVYPTLSSQDFTQIEKFIRQEKWPFRAQGLFRLLKTEKFKGIPSLEEAFFLTPEYLSVERLLTRTPVKLEKKEILELLLSGDWGRLAAQHEKQRAALDLSDGPRRLFLLNWIQNGSSPAASLLLKGDWEFALKKLDDKTTIQILHLLKEKTDLAKKYAEEILKTPRSDAVQRSALAYVPGKGDPVDLKKEASLKLLPKSPLKPSLKAGAAAPLPPAAPPAQNRPSTKARTLESAKVPKNTPS